MTASKLKLLREKLNGQNVQCMIVPMSDRFGSEFVPSPERRLEWLTGFTGSAGLAVVMQKKAAFFTDGRYRLQAKDEVSEEFELYDSTEMNWKQWLQKNIEEGQKIGLDMKLHSWSEYIQLENTVKRIGADIVPLCPNPIDECWDDRSSMKEGKIFNHPELYAGASHTNKINNISSKCNEEGGDYLLVSAPESICWLLNIRGDDIPCTPVALSYLILDAREGKATLYLPDHYDILPAKEVLTNKALVKEESQLEEDLSKSFSYKGIIIDSSITPAVFAKALYKSGAQIIERRDLCALPKACKNEVEVNGSIEAHIKDGIALCEFIFWLNKKIGKGKKITELSAAEHLESLRSKQENFYSPSFETISGYGKHGAVVHYRANKKTNAKIKEDGLYLVDSGGQYFEGTTDVTRTIAIGKSTDEQKQRYTDVLKGHIAIARSIFPEGTTGSQLDALARHALWQNGLDYAHGTGHGVGSFLGVHEGPQSISKRVNDVALMPGMIISNEPGFYKENEYGIRIENLVVVVKAEKEGFLKMETLTQAPLDIDLIISKRLTSEEKLWVNNYHNNLYKKLSPRLGKEIKLWLHKATASI